MDLHSCSVCSKQYADSDSVRCSRCLNAQYCSIECKKKARPTHKKHCKEAEKNKKRLGNGGLTEERNNTKSKRMSKEVVKGHAGAQLALALAYMKGDEGIEVDKAEGFKWLRKSAKAGDADAMFHLAICYENGDGCSISEEKAFDWYKEAANVNHPGAMFNLGHLYDTQEDKKSAFKWWKKAARLGHVGGMFIVGLLYFLGADGVEQNKQEALHWLSRAADEGDDVDAMFHVALLYDDESEEFLVDKKQAVAWYTRAAEKGHSAALFNLAHAYDIGEGCVEDKALAIKLWKEAAESDPPHIGAQFVLGLVYYSGDGVEKDSAEAVKYFTMAAEGGEIQAMHFLGPFFESTNLRPWLRTSRQGCRLATWLGIHQCLDWPFFEPGYLG